MKNMLGMVLKMLVPAKDTPEHIYLIFIELLNKLTQ